MPPAPALGTIELAYEMAEVYELACLRDEPLTSFSEGTNDCKINESIGRLNRIEFDLSGKDARPRKNTGGQLCPQTAFRGSSPGVEQGPYLSQFMLIGNKSVAGDLGVASGLIQYGALCINQKVPIAKCGVDFMTQEKDWLDVQNGAAPHDGNEAELFGAPKDVKRRFICTPRDLATYVHYDALYEAYLNACLILLAMKTPFDPGFDALSGNGKRFLNSISLHDKNITSLWVKQDREAGGFALWGGPHILTLVTEVATRALKAVRYQKFNTHCRLRPEALAGRIHKANKIKEKFAVLGEALESLDGSISETTQAIFDLNNAKHENGPGTKLLPMAFQEGSPMHPSYGAGHATVAGACVTILKAYFDTSAVFVERKGDQMFAHFEEKDKAVLFVPDDAGDTLVKKSSDTFLTLEGELNKLAANISIGRNMAGVHYFSDYYDSLRMGEEIAIGMLEEQALCYKEDPFVLSVPTFDGPVRTIGKR